MGTPTDDDVIPRFFWYYTAPFFAIVLSYIQLLWGSDPSNVELIRTVVEMTLFGWVMTFLLRAESKWNSD